MAHSTLLTIHRPTDAHLAEVITAMRTLGSPTVRVVDCGDYLMALEGSHRIAACKVLGIAPDLVVLSQDDLVDADSLDWQDLQSGESYTAGELAAEAYSPQAVPYSISHDGVIV